MQSARLSRNRSRCQRTSSTSKEDDDDPSSLSRPSTQDSKRSSYSRMSTDSGAGSLDDFNNRRNSSPDFWISRRHTAPTRKLISPDIDEDGLVRPNTVHAWDTCSPRCSLSRYAPLPGIGIKQDNFRAFDRPVPVRRQCFMGPLDIDNPENSSLEDANENDNEAECQESLSDIKPPPLFSLTLDSDIDSDFDEEAENVQQFVSDFEDTEDRPKRTIIRSATFTIEKERPDNIRGPFLTIAVRLPDGTRVADKFDCKDVLGSVCEFALDKFEEPRPERYALITTDVPKRTFKDMTICLRDAGIGDKTLLYLQSLDDCYSD